MSGGVVLVLNQNYEPLNVCPLNRAVVLVYLGRAEMLENGRGFIHSANLTLPAPSVIKLVYQIKRPRPKVKLTRMSIFARDWFTCQYCGCRGGKLTIDHVVPRYLGGGHSWENIVTACVSCNHHKAGRTPAQAGMKLMCQPAKPSYDNFPIPERYRYFFPEWEPYLMNVGPRIEKVF